MRWEDEQYARLFIRDTPSWLALSFDAQALLMHLLRKVDRAGLLELAQHGKRGVAIAIHHAHLWERLAPALEELLEDGCVEISGDRLVIPNFLTAQTCAMSDSARKRVSRERARANAVSGAVTNRDERPVTKSDEKSRELPARERERERERKQAGKGGKTAHDVAALRALWNEVVSPPLRAWGKTGKTRHKAAQAALARRPLEGDDGWRAVFARARLSPFLSGGGPQGWKAHPDFVLRGEGKKAETASRILEGEFDGNVRSSAAGPVQTPRELKSGEDLYAD